MSTDDFFFFVMWSALRVPEEEAGRFEGFEDTAYSSLAVLEPPCCLFSPLVILYVKYQHSSISVYKGNQV